MAVNRSGIKITDGSTSYRFSLSPTGRGGRGLTIQTRAWEPGDPQQAWRVPLHPWDAGLNSDRLNARPRSYAKGNCDASNPGLLLPPPKVNSVTMANAVTPTKEVEFNSLKFFVSGRYMYYFNPADGTVTQDKDFGVGKAAVDAAVFNNELIVAMGETEKIYKRTTGGTWTQATDATYAIALGVVGSQLWRAESTNKLSSCTTTPLTLANWTPAAGTQYSVGDSTWPVHSIVDYGGAQWVFKADGVYAPNASSVFKNQCPQLKRWPDANNGKGAWVGQGALWVPSASGLFRIRVGESKKHGPEVTLRPSYRFWVRGGVEFGDCMYLLVTDEAASGNTAIIKMQRDIDGVSGREYIYHEWAQLDGTTKGYFIGVTTAGTNPQLVCGYGNDIRYIKLGRGGGRDTDDGNYEFGTATTLETGVILPGPDLGVVSVLQGVTTVLDFSAAGETLSVAYKTDGTGAYADLLTTSEGGGTAVISSTTDFQAVTRYAPSTAVGQFFEFKFTGALTSASGTNRPEIREAWAFGYSRPKVTDTVSLAIHAGPGTAAINGIPNGQSQEETVRLFRNWMESSTVLTVEIPEYEQGRTTRFLVTNVEVTEQEATIGQQHPTTASRVLVALTRLDFAGAFAD